MTTWLTRTTIALLLMSVTPATASAQFWDFMKWLNDMSGPQMIGVRASNSRSGAGTTQRTRSADRLHRLSNRRRPSTDRRQSLTWAPALAGPGTRKQLGNETTVRDISMFSVRRRGAWSPRS